VKMGQDMSKDEGEIGAALTKLHAVTAPEEQSMLWEAYPSWAQFTWLYLVSAISALRAALLFRFGVGGWEIWLGGAGILIVCAAMLRRWAHYELTRNQIMLRNGYTRHEIQSVRLSEVGEVTVRQGLVADFFGIGTVVVHSRTNDRMLSLRGVSDPEEIKIRIKALAWKHNRVANHPRGSL
jgi:membrane protein YdbS with pleckstrin-like domain